MLFMLVLFSALVRWLRRLGVRALKQPKACSKMGHKQTIDAVARVFVSLYQDLGFRRVAPQIDHAPMSVDNDLSDFHKDNHRSARARSQAQTVLVPREKRQNIIPWSFA